MSRYRDITVAEMNPAQKRVHDHIIAGRRGRLSKLPLALPAVSPAGRPRFRAPFQRSCAAYAAYRKRSSAASFNHSFS